LCDSHPDNNRELRQDQATDWIRLEDSLLKEHGDVESSVKVDKRSRHFNVFGRFAMSTFERLNDFNNNVEKNGIHFCSKSE